MSKIKIDLNQPLLDIDDKTPVGDQTIGRLLAVHLSRQPDGPAEKLYYLAKELYASGQLELDPTDWETLRQAVDRLPGLNIVAKGPILAALREAKEKAKP